MKSIEALIELWHSNKQCSDRCIGMCEGCSKNIAYKKVLNDLEILSKYRELVREYASLKGRNLNISVEELGNDFKELEYGK